MCALCSTFCAVDGLRQQALLWLIVPQLCRVDSFVRKLLLQE
jgi:hypothetical protein